LNSREEATHALFPGDINDCLRHNWLEKRVTLMFFYGIFDPPYYVYSRPEFRCFCDSPFLGEWSDSSIFKKTPPLNSPHEIILEDSYEDFSTSDRCFNVLPVLFIQMHPTGAGDEGFSLERFSFICFWGISLLNRSQHSFYLGLYERICLFSRKIAADLLP